MNRRISTFAALFLVAGAAALVVVAGTSAGPSKTEAKSAVFKAISYWLLAIGCSSAQTMS